MRYLYLHGFCSGPSTFKGSYFRRRFAEHGLDLLTPDLNGDDFAYLTLSNQLAIVREALAERDEAVTLIGSSMGGYLACLLAQELPTVQRLVLIAPAFRFLQRYLALLGEAQHDAWRQSGWLEVDHYQYGERRRLHYGIIDDARRYESLPLDRSLPALLFHGIHDDTVPYQSSIAYLDGNSQAELVLFPADHSLNAEIDRLWHHVAAELRIAQR